MAVILLRNLSACTSLLYPESAGVEWSVEQDDEESEEEKPKEKSRLAEFKEGSLGHITTNAIKSLVDREVNKLGSAV